MSLSRRALVAGVLCYATALVLAALLIPWDSQVAPWADLDLATIAAFTAEQVSAIDDYVASVWLPSTLAWLIGPIVAVVIAVTPRLRRAVTGMSLGTAAARRWPVIADAVAGLILFGAVRLVALPLEAWVAAVRRDNGLLTQSSGEWLARWVLESLVLVAVSTAALTLVLLILRRWPRRGWLTVMALALVGTALLTALIPLLQRVDGTVADPSLTARVQELAARLDVQVGQVVVVEVSDRTTGVNANVSGWGPTRTVTIYDTVTADAPPEAIDALIAHELVHVREGDVVIGVAIASLGAAGTAGILAALALSVSIRRRLGASGPGDVRLASLLVAAALVASLAGTVAASTLSRPLEARADREAIQITGDPVAYAELIRLLTVTNKSTLVPARWRYALLFTHPTPLQRLAAIPADQ